MWVRLFMCVCVGRWVGVSVGVGMRVGVGASVYVCGWVGGWVDVPGTSSGNLQSWC